MATDADLSDFKAALYDALIENRQFERLLAHPQFRSRIMRICRLIAEPDNVEDLFHEVCLKLLNHAAAGDLPALQTQHKVLGWVAHLARNVHVSKSRERIELMACTDESKGWPRSSSEVSIKLLDAYMDHAVECAYHAELMLLEEKEMEEELRTVFRLARGLDSNGQLLRGAMLVEAIADYDHRLESWKQERETANFPFHHIALYNGVRQIASCGRFFDFSRHESVNDLDTYSGLQIRGINASEQEDVLLGSYALGGVQHDGEEQVLPLTNGYTVGLRVIRLDEKTFAIGFRCVESETMEKLSYMQDFTVTGGNVSDRVSEIKDDPVVLLDANPFGKLKRLAPLAWSVSLGRSWRAVVNCSRAVRWGLGSPTKSFFKAFTKRPSIVQLGTTLLLVGLLLLFEGTAYLSILGSLGSSKKVSWVTQPSLAAQSLLVYSGSDLVQMLTVEKLINGTSYPGETVHIVSEIHRRARVAANNRKKLTSFHARDVRHRFATNVCAGESPRSSDASRLFCQAHRRCNATKAKTSVVAANISH